MDRRSFLRGSVSVAALAAMPLAALGNDKPVIHPEWVGIDLADATGNSSCSFLVTYERKGDAWKAIEWKAVKAS